MGICQLAPHDALDAATRGFKAALVEPRRGWGEGLTSRTPAASTTTAPPSWTALCRKCGPDAGQRHLFAPGSPVRHRRHPHSGHRHHQLRHRLGLDSTEDKVLGGNISGTSDLAPLDQQAAMLQELFPDAENVGLLYCSAEPNSVFQVETIQAIWRRWATPVPVRLHRRERPLRRDPVCL